MELNDKTIVGIFNELCKQRHGIFNKIKRSFFYIFLNLNMRLFTATNICDQKSVFKCLINNICFKKNHKHTFNPQFVLLRIQNTCFGLKIQNIQKKTDKFKFENSTNIERFMNIGAQPKFLSCRRKRLFVVRSRAERTLPLFEF